MAGLLDIFGSGGGQTLGLLGMSPEDIQRSRDDAQAQALYGLAARLFQGGNTGQSIAEGLQQGQKMYRSAMDTQLQEQLQGYQMQELLRKRKQEQEALARQAQIDRAVAGSYQPAIQSMPAQYYGQETQFPLMDDDGNMQPGATAPVVGRAAGLDLQSLAPVLMASPEGRKTLADLVASQKALRPETFSLAENATQFERDPFTGETRQIAQGIPKPVPIPKLTGKEGNAALMFYGTDDVNKLREIPGAIQKIQVEATTQRKAEQPQINLADPTAVQTQQLKTINQWEGVLKDSGAAETAMRAQGFYSAYEQAKKGNTTADGAMIYNVAKVYDPAGAVQAGDVSTVLGSRSVPENIKSYAQKLTTGGTLTPTERENMKKIIDTLVVERKKMIEPSLATYRGVNKRLGGEESAINNPFDMVKQPKSLEEILGLRPRGGN
jgi:hypothetical protein